MKLPKSLAIRCPGTCIPYGATFAFLTIDDLKSDDGIKLSEQLAASEPGLTPRLIALAGGIVDLCYRNPIASRLL